MRFFCWIFIISSLINGTSHSHGLATSKRFKKSKSSRFSTALTLGTHIVADDAGGLGPYFYGFGLERMVGQLNFAKQFRTGLDFVTNFTVGGGSYGKLFQTEEKSKDYTGLNMDLEFGLRYLYRVNDLFDIGGVAMVGAGTIYGEAFKTPKTTAGILWPLHLKAGPAARFEFIDKITLYANVHYTLKNFGKPTASKTLAATPYGGVMKHGIEIPIGVIYDLNEAFGLFGEVNLALNDFNHQNLGFAALVSFGFTFDYGYWTI